MLLHLAYFLNTVTTVVTAMGGASNAVYQRFCASVRKKDERASINFNVDIQRWILENALPALQSDLRQNKIYAVLMGAQDQPDEPAVALTGKTQVGWLQQLVGHHGKWALHVDGKHKLHHGGWILVTYGTHTPEFRENKHGKSNKRAIVHAFRPLLYLFSKSHEAADSIVFGLKAMETIVRK